PAPLNATELHHVDGVSPSAAWVTARSTGDSLDEIPFTTEAYRWDGIQWNAVLVQDEIDGVAMTAANDTWFVGQDAAQTEDRTEAIWHWDGSTLAELDLKAPFNSLLLGVDALSTGQVVVTGGSNGGDLDQQLCEVVVADGGITPAAIKLVLGR